MLGLYSKYLIFNGAVVLLAGLLSGFPLWYAIIRKMNPEKIHAWRVSHSVLITDGLMILIIGIIIPHLIFSDMAAWILVWSLIISGYSFVVTHIIGAWRGYRGLAAKPYGLNTILFGAHIIGAFGSLIGIAIVLYGSLRAF